MAFRRARSVCDERRLDAKQRTCRGGVDALMRGERTEGPDDLPPECQNPQHAKVEMSKCRDELSSVHSGNSSGQ